MSKRRVEVDAVAMVRRVRDQHAEELEGKSPEEVIACYRERASAVEAQLKAERKGEGSNKRRSA